MTRLALMKEELKKCSDEHDNDPWIYNQEETHAEIDAMDTEEECLDFAKCGIGCCMEELEQYKAEDFPACDTELLKICSDNLKAWTDFVCKWQEELSR